MISGGRTWVICSASSPTRWVPRARLRVLNCVGFASRLRGLIGRRALRPGIALRLGNCSGIHTFGMRIPIDVAITDRLGHVLRTAPRLGPNRCLWTRAGTVIWEFRAGELQRLGIGPGVRIAERPPSSS